MTRPVRFLLAALLVAGGMSSQIAHAQLLGLTHDAGTAQVAEIDAASAVTPIGGPELPTPLGYAAAAFDPFAGAIFALGPDPVAADGTTALFSFDTTTGVRTQVGNTGSSEQVAALRYELASMRLIAVLVDSGTGTLRLASVDPGSAALTTINTGVTDCCVLEPGVATERTGDVLLVGRRTTDAAAERYLITLSTTGDNAASFTLLDGPISAMAWDNLAMTLYGIRQSTSAPPITSTIQIGSIDGTGAFTPIGTTLADCCALAPGFAAVALGTPDVLYTVGNAAGSAMGVVAWDATTGVPSFGGSLPTGTVINALFDISAGLTPTTTTIDSILPTPVTVGQNYTVTATVASMAAIDGGSITIDDGLGNSCAFAVSMAAPTDTCSLPATQVGMPAITAIFSGTTTLAPSFDTAPQTVAEVASSTSITNIVPSPVDVGQAYTVSIAVTGFNPTGTVDIDDGQGEICQVVLPATSCALNAPTVGPRTITANYSGDVNNLPSAGSAAQSVVQVVSTTTIDSIVPEPSAVGSAYTVTVTGFGPTGSVLVDDGVGNNCSIVPEPSIVGDAYAVNVTVTGFNPTGSVAVDDGNGNACSIVLPATSCQLANGDAGALTVTADYPGDANNTTSSDSAPHVVDPSPTTTTTSIDLLDPSPAGIGQPYSVEVSVTGFGPPTGTISVADDNGATCTITLPDTACDLTSTAIGTRTITADYSGDADNEPSSDSASQTITLAVTALVLTADNSIVPQGTPVDLTATVTDGFDPVTGTVDFQLEGVPIAGCTGVSVATDQATCSTSFANQGVFVASADYSGDVNNQPSSAEFLIQVQPLTIPTLSRSGLIALLVLLTLFAMVALRRRRIVS